MVSTCLGKIEGLPDRKGKIPHLGAVGEQFLVQAALRKTQAGILVLRFGTVFVNPAAEDVAVVAYRAGREPVARLPGIVAAACVFSLPFPDGSEGSSSLLWRMAVAEIPTGTPASPRRRMVFTTRSNTPAPLALAYPRPLDQRGRAALGDKPRGNLRRRAPRINYSLLRGQEPVAQTPFLSIAFSEWGRDEAGGLSHFRG